MSIIQPRTLKGFRDYLPVTMTAREQVIETARQVYRLFGFTPIDTPALEYSEILFGKGSDETDRQMYRFEDNGGRDVAMRFDLTVPLARFIAQHVGTLGTPFKRYAVGPVWRGENTQRGRYREFIQFDFDTIGTESLVADIETWSWSTISSPRSTSPNSPYDSTTVSCSTVCWTASGSAAKPPAVLRSLDKLPKIGAEGVRSELVEVSGATGAQADEILALAGLGRGQRRDPGRAARDRRIVGSGRARRDCLANRARRGDVPRVSPNPGFASMSASPARPRRTTPVPSSRHSSTNYPTSVASARAGDTTTWPLCTPSSAFPASGARSVSTG